jgi:erythromycin esterase-like protein
MNRTMAVGFLILIVGHVGVATAQDRKFVDKLVESRLQVKIEGERMTGGGADLLRSALGGVQYVLIGEDHATSQIPAFTSALCSILGPQGFHTMAVEAGPMAAAIVQRGIGRDDRREQIAASEKKYPDSIAFFNLQEELDMVTSCAQSAKDETFHLWGLDQEFMGSTGMTMARILETHPQRDAAAAAQRILDENNVAAVKAAKSGNPGELLMMSAPDEEFTRLNQLLQKEGNTDGERLMRGLIESRQIYKDNVAAPSMSNRERALLMKQTFMQDYNATAKGSWPKVLMKFGDWHSPFHQ